MPQQTSTPVSAEQLEQTAGRRREELVRGELVEMTPVGGPHSELTVLLGSWLVPFVRKNKLGAVGIERGFILSRDPDTVRAPDLHFISKERLALGSREGFFPGAPDLAVEILSPTDRAGDVQARIREYLNAGTRLVWVVDPHSETVTAYHPAGDARIYSGEQAVPGEDVLPGFSFLPADLFRLD